MSEIFLLNKTSCNYLSNEDIELEDIKINGDFNIFFEEVVRTEKRAFKTFLEYNKSFFGRKTGFWREKGFNHEQNKDGISRQFLLKKIVIKFESLEQLKEFAIKNGEVIITTDNDYNIPTIEIYDDYRE